jgi:hypothetical protein
MGSPGTGSPSVWHGRRQNETAAAAAHLAGFTAIHWNQRRPSKFSLGSTHRSKDMPLHFPRRLRKNSSTDPWRFGLDVCEVMWARISRGMTGRLSAEEARRMIVEKQTAGARAQLAYLEWLFQGNPAAGGRAAFAVYNGVVQSNRRRLNHRRWRWPTG